MLRRMSILETLRRGRKAVYVVVLALLCACLLADYVPPISALADGVTLPADCAVPALVADRLDVTRAPTPKAAYPKRYDFLTDTNSTVRAKWLAWRAGRVTDYMKKLSRRLREANPDFTIYVKVGSSLMGMGGNN